MNKDLPFGSEDGEPPATKPPLGVAPKEIWVEIRVADLARAIHEYLEYGLTPKQEWIDELAEHFPTVRGKRTPDDLPTIEVMRGALGPGRCNHRMPDGSRCVFAANHEIPHES